MLRMFKKRITEQLSEVLGMIAELRAAAQIMFIVIDILKQKGYINDEDFKKAKETITNTNKKDSPAMQCGPQES